MIRKKKSSFGEFLNVSCGSLWSLQAKKKKKKKLSNNDNWKLLLYEVSLSDNISAFFLTFSC